MYPRHPIGGRDSLKKRKIHEQLWDAEAAVGELGCDASSQSSACIAFLNWCASAKTILILAEEISSSFEPRGFAVLYTISRSGTRALSNGAIPKLIFLVSGRISIVMSTFWLFRLCDGRSDDEFGAEEGQNPIFDHLPRNEKTVW